MAAKKKKAVTKKKIVKAKTKAKAKVQKTKATVTQKKSKKTAAKKVSPVISKKIQQLIPLDDRIVVELKDLARKTAGGLYIPETANVSGNYQGQVLATGKGHTNKKGKVKPMEVRVGDVVMFDQYAGTNLNLDGMEIRILRESEVLGIIEKEGRS